MLRDLATPIWTEDHTAVRPAIEALEREGVEDVYEYLMANPVAFAHILASMRMVHANRRAAELVGGDADGRVSGPVARWLHPSSHEYIARGLAVLHHERKPFQAEVRLLKADGHAVDVALTASRAPDDPDVVVIVIHDITERSEARREIAELRELLEAAVQSSPAGILIADAPDVTIRMANRAALGIRDGAPDELTDIPAELHPERWQCFHPDGRPYRPEDLPLSRAVLHGEVTENVDVIIRRPDGEERWVLGNAAPLRDADGTIRGGLVVFPDVTELKQKEQELRTLNRTLERRVEERTSALELEMQQLAHAAAHDLREPLEIAASYLALAQRRYGEQSDGEATALLGRAALATAQMQELVRGLRRYSHALSGMSGLEEAGDSAVALRRAMQELGPTIAREDATVDVGVLPLVRASEMSLTAVFRELILNALRYRRSAPLEISIDADRRGTEWVFGVRDNGIGIDRHEQERVFALLQRGEAGRLQGATGVGLAICQRIVRRVGGRLWVSSKRGAGSTFYFSIPGVKPTTAADTA